MRTRIALAFSMASLMLALALPGAAFAKSKDRNHDRIPDRWERTHKLSLKVNQAKRDQDHDGLNNLGEYRAKTDPRDDDTDDDGAEDGDEMKFKFDPRDSDSDDDGREDGKETRGSVVSFDGTTLVIRSTSGETLTGAVTSATEIECEDDHEGGEDNDGKASASSGRDGDRHGDDDEKEGDDEKRTCGTADLKPGALVHEAELKLTAGGAVFEEIELVS